MSITMNPKELWKKTLAELQIKLPPSDFNTFFSETRISSLKMENPAAIEIACPHSFGAKRLKEKYIREIEKSLEKIIDKKVAVAFKVEALPSPITRPLGPLFDETTREEQKDLARETASLYARYKFDNFVVGSNNRLAHAVALGIAEAPGRSYNPFFLYSGVGLGKTHLIQAIGNTILEKYPKMKVVYCSGEMFTNELITAIQKRTQGFFRKKFRKADVLLIDDIQFIAGRETIQEEFFNTFNALYLAEKQIVLTSDRSPKEITKLEDRLRSRFSGGMIADMQAPDLDMRMAILKSKAKSSNYHLKDEVLEVIARNINTNIRELEGGLRQIIAYANTQGEQPTVDTAQEILKATRNIMGARAITPKKIIETICAHFALSSRELKGPRRVKELVFPRQLTMYLIRELTRLPLMEIGEVLGGRDHTTIIHGIAVIEKKIKEEKQIKSQVQLIKNQLE